MQSGQTIPAPADPRLRHQEHHSIDKLGWLRAAVLGANDGVLSTASLIIGVVTAHASRHGILIAGVAGLVAGAMSMAAGEYVSVSSQSDAERADLERERRELTADRAGEFEELTKIYEARGLRRKLAVEVADQLMAHNALEAHARDELGLGEGVGARPVQAALASAASFAVGAVVPLFVAVAMPFHGVAWAIAIASLLFLALLGVLGAVIGRAPPLRAATRVVFWGALAMAVTAAIGAMFGTQIG